MEKTQAMRILEGRNVAYEALTYDASNKDATQVASALGINESHVYKTLVVVRSDRKPILAMIPAGATLDLKMLARESGDKKVKMASHAEAEKLTGLQVGGISALALLNRGFDIWIDSSVGDQALVCISAGRRGVQLRLEASQLVEVTQARKATISR